MMRISYALLLSAMTVHQAAAKFVRYTGPAVCARGTGDPHMTTYDGVKYDCQGEGDFIMSKSLDGDFELQGRYEIVPGKSVTTTQGVVLNTGYANEPKVEIAYTKQCDLSYMLDGVTADLENAPAKNNSDYFLFFSQGTYRSFIFASGVTLKVSLRKYRGDCLLSTYLCIPEALAKENVVGILGTPDTDKDDFMNRDGTPFVPKPLTRHSKNAYCKAVWCVPTVEDNLFNVPGAACGDEVKPSEEIIFGPTHEEVKCGEMEENMKCPLGHTDRLYRLPPTGKAPQETFESCRQACLDNPDCGFYSFGMPKSSHPGVCMGCSSSTKREKHKGFNFYAKDCVGDQKIGELDRLVDNADPKIVSACEHNDGCIIDAVLSDGTIDEQIAEGLRTLEEEKVDPAPPSQEVIDAAITQKKAAISKKKAADQVSDADKTTNKAFTSGDPHFKTFGGVLYDYHGECDLVLLHNPEFKNGLGMDIHIRTKITDFWSSVESAAIKIGDHFMQLDGGDKDQWLFFNGVGNEVMEDSKWYRFDLAGFLVRAKQTRAGREAQIYLEGPKEVLSIKAYHDFVRVEIDWEGSDNYKGATGLLGHHELDGKRVGRDGVTAIEDVNEFGQEWQVREEEDKLFHSYDGAVQAPNKCILPTPLTQEAKQLRNRRLAESDITMEKAEKACGGLQDAAERKACMYDVLATQDLGIAAGAW